MVVAGGFTPIPPRLWALDRRAHALGFPGLRAFLDARYAHAGCSLPALAADLRTSVWLVRAAMDAHRIPRLPGPQAKGRARKAVKQIAAAKDELSRRNVEITDRRPPSDRKKPEAHKGD